MPYQTMTIRKYFIAVFLLTSATPATPAIAATVATVATVAARKVPAEFATITIDRPAFYTAMQSENRDLINQQLASLDSVPGDQGLAFRGALTMKKAGVGGDPATKLSLFKKGRKMLEAAISANPDNTEYRFLRLMIQEHTPGILGYKSDEEKDSEYIQKNFKSLPSAMQEKITEYSKKSKILKLQFS